MMLVLFDLNLIFDQCWVKGLLREEERRGEEMGWMEPSLYILYIDLIEKGDGYGMIKIQHRVCFCRTKIQEVLSRLIGVSF